MNPAARITIALVIAIVAANLTSVIQTGAMFDPILLIAFAIACIACSLVPAATSRPASQDATPSKQRSGKTAPTKPPVEGDRDFGKVKWFNVSKGFGFIIKDDGEEIFVHFRSIRGSGRRGLRDGQRVSFVVTDSDKGPQAEDVDPEA